MTTALNWTPFPGHYPGQAREHVFYAESMYRGMVVTLFEMGPEPRRWEFAFYDPNGGPEGDPDLAIAIGEPAATFEEAVKNMTDYIDSYVEEDRA